MRGVHLWRPSRLIAVRHGTPVFSSPARIYLLGFLLYVYLIILQPYLIHQEGLSRIGKTGSEHHRDAAGWV